MKIRDMSVLPRTGPEFKVQVLLADLSYFRFRFRNPTEKKPKSPNFIARNCFCEDGEGTACPCLKTFRIAGFSGR